MYRNVESTRSGWPSASPPPLFADERGRACRRRAPHRNRRSTDLGRRGSAAPASMPAPGLPDAHRGAGGWPSKRAGDCCRQAAAERGTTPGELRAASPRLLQLGEDHRHVRRIDGTDVLVANDALAIDDEALRDTGRAERDLQLALRVASDPLVRVAVAREEIGDVLRPIANGDAVDSDSAVLELLQDLHFGDA